MKKIIIESLRKIAEVEFKIVKELLEEVLYEDNICDIDILMLEQHSTDLIHIQKVYSTCENALSVGDSIIEAEIKNDTPFMALDFNSETFEEFWNEHCDPDDIETYEEVCRMIF